MKYSTNSGSETTKRCNKNNTRRLDTSEDVRRVKARLLLRRLAKSQTQLQQYIEEDERRDGCTS